MYKPNIGANIMQRECTICKQEKPLEEFGKSKKGKYGHDAQCKKCRYQRTGRAHFLANKEKCYANAAKWHKENREHINKKNKERYDADPSKVLERQRLYPYIARESTKRYREKHREKVNAQCQLRDHVKRGNIIKPTTCSICNSDQWIEAHHADYTKPLEVVWLCKKCHVAIHKGLQDRVQRERPNSRGV
jgi:hypothetical protein